MASSRNEKRSFRRSQREGQKNQVASGFCRDINFKIIKSFEKGDLAEVLSTVAGHLPWMNLVNLTTALHRLAKMTSTCSKSQDLLKGDPGFEQLLHSIFLWLDTLEPGVLAAQPLSNVAWALATLNLGRTDLVSKVVALASSSVSSFKPFEMSTFLWACAKLGAMDDSIAQCTEPLFEAAASHITATAEVFSFRCLANALWAFATAKQYNASLFSCTIAHMLPHVHVANCQELANTTWALGKVTFWHEEMFSELANHAFLRLPEFKPQELSNIIWGFGSVGFFHKEFLIGATAALRTMDLTTQHLANILAAVVCAAPGHPVTRATILSLLPRCCDQMGAFKPQEMSASMLALAKAFGSGRGRPPCNTDLQHEHAVPKIVHQFVAAAAPWVIPRLPNFAAQSLVSLTTACTRLRVSGAQHLIDAVSAEASKRCSQSPLHADLVLCLRALNLAESAVQRDPEQIVLAMVPCLTSNPIPKKQEKSKRRCGRACGTAADGRAAQSQTGAWPGGRVIEGNVGGAPMVDSTTDLYLQYHLASDVWTSGVGTKWLPPKPQQEAVDKQIAAFDVGASRVATPGPTSKLNEAWGSSSQVQVMLASEASAQTCFAGSGHVRRGRSARSPLAAGRLGSPDLKWKCSVKNSFLHLDIGCDSDSTDDGGSCDGGSSQRSSSVPCRLGYQEPAEEWHKRYVDEGQEMACSQRYSDDLASFHFTWQMPASTLGV